MTEIQRAIEILGGPSKTARMLGVTPQAVCFWRDGERSTPIEHCPSIERETNCAVTCDEMRDDVTWVRVPDPDWPHPDGRPLVDHSQKKAA